jgi:CopA family copper-resistance protein
LTQPSWGRRGFLAAGAALAGWPGAAAAASPEVLTGSAITLVIQPVGVNITGQPRLGVGINGRIPAPILHWHEGDTVTVTVINQLAEPTSLHWHGLRVAMDMDGVPGFGFRAIAPGETFVYRLPLTQSGTYWYHAHSGLQEQNGLYGAIVIDPAGGYTEKFDRDYVLLLADWSDERPETILSNLKFNSDHYNQGRRTLGGFLEDANRVGFKDAIADRLLWGGMRMNPTDILDVSGATYTYLLNGQPPARNWTALFRPNERVQLRLINASAMTVFDVRLPDLPLRIVAADGNDV